MENIYSFYFRNLCHYTTFDYNWSLGPSTSCFFRNTEISPKNESTYYVHANATNGTVNDFLECQVCMILTPQEIWSKIFQKYCDKDAKCGLFSYFTQAKACFLMGVNSGFDEVNNVFAISGFKRCPDPLTFALEMDKAKMRDIMNTTTTFATESSITSTLKP